MKQVDFEQLCRLTETTHLLADDRYTNNNRRVQHSAGKIDHISGRALLFCTTVLHYCFALLLFPVYCWYRVAKTVVERLTLFDPTGSFVGGTRTWIADQGGPGVVGVVAAAGHCLRTGERFFRRFSFAASAVSKDGVDQQRRAIRHCREPLEDQWVRRFGDTAQPTNVERTSRKHPGIRGEGQGRREAGRQEEGQEEDEQIVVCSKCAQCV